jgi:transcription initiation factor TFIIIB Brf1 subunit/transcription initiation factor TFIIB
MKYEVGDKCPYCGGKLKASKSNPQGILICEKCGIVQIRK